MCVEFVKSYNLPMLVLGGGGYTIRNVARCWSYETSLLLDAEIDDHLPYNDYLEYYGPDFRLHIQPSNMENQNSTEYLQKHLVQLMENLRNVEHAPSVAPFQKPPEHFTADHEEDEDDNDADTHINRDDKHVYDPRELFDEDDKRHDPEKENANYKDKSEKNENTGFPTNNGPEAMEANNIEEGLSENSASNGINEITSKQVNLSTTVPEQQMPTTHEEDTDIHLTVDAPEGLAPTTDKMDLDDS
jgi:hypothetical protein